LRKTLQICTITRRIFATKLFLLIKILLNIGGHISTSVKVLFSCLSIGLILRLITFTMFGVYNSFLTFTRNLSVPLNFSFCFSLVIFYNVPSSIGYLILLIISLERFFQTFSAIKEVNFVQKSIISKLATLSLVWIVPLSIFLSLIYISISTEENTPLCYCATETIINGSLTSWYTVALIFILLSALAFFYWAKWRSEKLLGNFGTNTNLAWNSLQSRFFLNNSIKMIQSLMPMTILHASVSIVVLIMGNTSRWLFSDRVTNVQIEFRTSYMLIHTVECFVLPFVVVRYTFCIF